MKKILYGVQGTGNGHISRARAMAQAFKQHPDLKVDWLFSGRDRAALFDMNEFGAYRWHCGLTFASAKGRVNYWQTFRQCKAKQFIHDVRTLPLQDYDTIVTDFEPVTAWAARLQRRRIVGIGHQYAFQHAIPTAGGNPVSRAILAHFAPADSAVGLHWHHFDQDILPPIVALEQRTESLTERSKILVYLPFEQPEAVAKLLAEFGQFQFHCYHPELTNGLRGNICSHALSTSGFQTDLRSCNGVICNAGFELISEALALGKKVLAKPLSGQMEQLSNAEALLRLNYGSVMPDLNPEIVAAWLEQTGARKPIPYPDVAAALARWIDGDCRESAQQLAASLWPTPDPIPEHPGGYWMTNRISP